MRATWLQARMAQKRKRSQLSGDTHGAHDKRQKGARAKIFVEWLKGLGENLGAGSGVLDVAGGRGDVSFELHTVNGIRSTLVEPRRRKLNKAQHRWLSSNRGVKRAKKMERAVAAGTVADPLAPFLCAQVQEMFPFGAASLKGPRGAELRQLQENCSCVVGLHPDQATEAIVDFAVSRRKPFAVVPCCVFASASASASAAASASASASAVHGKGEGKSAATSDIVRQVARGEAAAVSMSFDEWLRYLQAKHPAIRSAFLNFNGKNCVLYCTKYGEDGKVASV